MPEHLDRLAERLTAAGWSAVTRHTAHLKIVRIASPAMPDIGDSILTHPDPDGAPWFWSALGHPIAPCSDLDRAVAQLTDMFSSPEAVAARLLAHMAEEASELDGLGRERHLRGARR